MTNNPQGATKEQLCEVKSFINNLSEKAKTLGEIKLDKKFNKCPRLRPSDIKTISNKGNSYIKTLMDKEEVNC